MPPPETATGNWLAVFPGRVGLNLTSASTHRRTEFFKALSAMYTYGPHPIFPYTPWDLNFTPTPSPDEVVAETSRPTPRASAQPSTSSSDAESSRNSLKKLPSGFTPSIFSQPIYRPCGKWAWVDGQTLIDIDKQHPLSTGSMCSASIRTGILGGREVTYICKGWNTSRKWEGFYSELALYKVHLQPLQGIVVPAIINVYSTVGYVNVAFEAPHHSFWIEASPDMPLILKKRCVEAYEKLHAEGVLHGDVELRHMLIGGDGKVTLIDFQESRAVKALPQVGLEAASPEELRREMRKVMVKLDYPGARDMEVARRDRPLERVQRRREEQSKSERTPRYRPKKVPSPEDEISDPPIPVHEWQEDWIGPPVIPQRFVMPNQTPEELESEIQAFLSLVDRWQRAEEGSAGLHSPPSSPLTTSPIVLPTTFTSPVLAEVFGTSNSFKADVTPANAQPSDHSSSPQSLERKRKMIAAEASEPPPPKRTRVLTASAQSSDSETPVAAGKPTLSVEAVSVSQDPASSVTPCSPPPSTEPRRWPWPTNLAAPAGEGRPRSRTEEAIQDENVKRCDALGLPHPQLLKTKPGDPRWSAPDVLEYRRSLTFDTLRVIYTAYKNPEQSFRLPRPPTALGNLKRKMDRIRGSHQKRKLGEDCDDIERYESHEISDVREGPKILKTTEVAAHRTANSRPSRGHRGILKDSRPRTSLYEDLEQELYDEDDMDIDVRDSGENFLEDWPSARSDTPGSPESPQHCHTAVLIPIQSASINPPSLPGSAGVHDHESRPPSWKDVRTTAMAGLNGCALRSPLSRSITGWIDGMWRLW